MLTSKSRSPTSSPPPEPADAAAAASAEGAVAVAPARSRSVGTVDVATGDLLATALVIAELGPSLVGNSVGSIVKTAVSTVQESFLKTTQLRLLRLHHLYERHFADFAPCSAVIKQLIAATTAKDGSSPDSLLRLVSRDEWLERCESKSVLKSTAAEILQILFDANMKADPGTVTSSCIHTIALHLVDMTFFKPSHDGTPYIGKRTRAGDIQALSSFCMGLCNSIDTGIGEKEKYILKAGSNMQGKISTFLKVSIKLDECLKIFQSAASVSSRHGSLQVADGGGEQQQQPFVFATAADASELLDFEPLKQSIVSSLLNLANVEICRVVHLGITYPGVKNTFVTAVEVWDDLIKARQNSFSFNNLLGAGAGAAAKEGTPVLIEGSRRIVRLFTLIQKGMQSPGTAGIGLTDSEWMAEYEYFRTMGKSSSPVSTSSTSASTAAAAASNSVPTQPTPPVVVLPVGPLPFKTIVPGSQERITTLVANAGLLLLFAHSLLNHDESKPLNHLTVVRIHVQDLLTNLVEETESLFQNIKEFRVDSGEQVLAEVAWYRYVCDYADVCLVGNEKKRIMQDFLVLDALCGGKGGMMAAAGGEDGKELKSLFSKLKLQWFSSSSGNLSSPSSSFSS